MDGEAGTVFEDVGLPDGETFAVFDALGVAVDEDGVGAGDNDAGRLEDGDGDEVALLLSFSPVLPEGDFPIFLAGEPLVGALLYVPENLQ